jgi:hypothetical protein
MSHLARGPVRSTGIDSTANTFGGRHAGDPCESGGPKEVEV